jgi:hypothetical protein
MLIRRALLAPLVAPAALPITAAGFPLKVSVSPATMLYDAYPFVVAVVPPGDGSGTRMPEGRSVHVTARGNSRSRRLGLRLSAGRLFRAVLFLPDADRINHAAPW